MAFTKGGSDGSNSHCQANSKLKLHYVLDSLTFGEYPQLDGGCCAARREIRRCRG